MLWSGGDESSPDWRYNPTFHFINFIQSVYFLQFCWYKVTIEPLNYKTLQRPRRSVKETSKWRRIQLSNWRLIKSINEHTFYVNWRKSWSAFMILQKLFMLPSMIIWAVIFQAASVMHQDVEIFQEMKIFCGNKSARLIEWSYLALVMEFSKH